MQSPANALVDYLGIGEPKFDLRRPERRELLVISVLPAILLIATLIQLGYEIEGSPLDVSFRDSSLYRLSGVVQAPAAYVGLAVMMIAGIGRITRSQASWCLVGAMVFAGLALLSGIYASMFYALIDPRDFQAFQDYQPDIALRFAGFAGLVAAGYGFLAFRGLAPPATE